MTKAASGGSDRNLSGAEASEIEGSYTSAVGLSHPPSSLLSERIKWWAITSNNSNSKAELRQVNASDHFRGCPLPIVHPHSIIPTHMHSSHMYAKILYHYLET